MSRPDPVSPSRRRALKAALGLDAYSLAAGCISVDSRPNLVLVIADDFSLEFDHELVRTLNMDALARDCVFFENAYAAAPSCSPARAPLFTGVYPHRHGVLGLSKKGRRFEIAPGYRCQHLVQYLKDAGYYTGNLGKLHVAPEAAFDFDFRRMGDMRDPDAIVRGLEDFFASAPADRPFFLIVGLFDPHAIKNVFVDRHKGLPEEIVRPEQVNALPFQLVDEPAQRRRIAGYYNRIKRMDIPLGAVVQVLRQRGRLDDSAVIFTSDQGPAFTRSKTTVYEAAVKVPLYLRASGAVGGGDQVAEFVSHIDIAPTFLALAKAARPALPGFDLRAIAVGETRRRFLFTEADYHLSCRFFPQRGVRNQRYKLIENLGVGILNYSASLGVRSIDADRSYEMAMQPKYRGTVVEQIYLCLADPPRFEFYDLETDPHELRNLIGTPELTDIEGELRKAMHEWQIQDDDPNREVGFIVADRARHCRGDGRDEA